MQEWQGTQARGAFAEIIDAAAEGMPQLIRRRDEEQVVVVSRSWFQAAKPNLRDYLLTAGYADGHDAFDDALESVRADESTVFGPRAVDFGA